MAERNVALNIILGAVNRTGPSIQSAENGLRGLKQRAQEFNDKWGEVIATSRRVGAAMLAAGGVIIGGMVAAGQQAAAFGSEISDMAARTGLGAEALTALQYAAGQTGASMQNVEVSLRRLSKNALDAMRSSGSEAGKAFAQLGIQVAGADGKLRPISDLFAEVGDKLRGVTNETERSALATALLGRSGAMLLPMFTDASRSMTDFINEAKRLGLTISDETAAKLDDLDDSIARLKLQATMGFRQLGAVVVPVLQQLIGLLSKALGHLQRFAEAHPLLSRLGVVGAAAIGMILTALGALLVVLPGAVQGWNLLTSAQLRNAAAAARAAAANSAAGAAASGGGAGAAAGAAAGFGSRLLSAVGSIGVKLARLVVPLGALLAGLGPALAGIGSAIAEVLPIIALVVAGIAAALAQIYLMRRAWRYVIENFKALPRLASGALTGVAQAFTDLGSTITGGFAAAWQGISGFFAQVGTAIISFFSDLPRNVGRAIGLTVGVILWLPTGLRLAAQQISAGLVALTAWFATLPATIGAAITQAVQWLQALPAAGWQALSTFAAGIGESVTAAVGYLASLPGAAYQAAAGLVQSLGTWLSNLPERVAAWFAGVWDYLRGLPQQWYEAGRALVQGLIDGLKSKWNDFLQGIREGLQAARNMLPHSEPKEGPLRGLKDSGRALAAQFGAGVREGFANMDMAGSLQPLALTLAGAGAGAGGASTATHVHVHNTYVTQLDGKVIAENRHVQEAIVDGSGRTLRGVAQGVRHGYAGAV